MRFFFEKKSKIFTNIDYIENPSLWIENWCLGGHFKPLSIFGSNLNHFLKNGFFSIFSDFRIFDAIFLYILRLQNEQIWFFSNEPRMTARCSNNVFYVVLRSIHMCSFDFQTQNDDISWSRENIAMYPNIHKVRATSQNRMNLKILKKMVNMRGGVMILRRFFWNIGFWPRYYN